MPWMVKIGQVVVEIWMCSEPSLRWGPFLGMVKNNPPQPKPSFHSDTGGFNKQEVTQAMYMESFCRFLQ